jgi:hypothetical protein
MLFMETVAVYCENNTEYGNKLCVQDEVCCCAKGNMWLPLHFQGLMLHLSLSKYGNMTLIF